MKMPLPRIAPLLLSLAACGGEVVEGSGAEPPGSSGEPVTASSGEPVTATSGDESPTTTQEPAGSTSTTESIDEPSSGDSGSSSSDETTGAPAVCGDGVVGGSELCDPPDGEPSGCTSQCTWARSCLDLLNAKPGLPDQTYEIDPESDGSPLKLYCDMTGGGWTQVVYDDFSGTSKWSIGMMSKCGAFGDVLGGAGQFGKGAAPEHSFELLKVSHTQVRVIADIVIIDSWDDEEIVLSADGQEIAKRACKEYDAGTCNQTKNECGGGWREGEIKLSGIREHATDSLLLLLSTNLSGDANNEAWGLNTLHVFVK